MRGQRIRRGLAATAAAACAALATATPATAGTAYPVGDLGTAVGNYLFSPGAVAGANDWSCRPSGEHPVPVVLVHGTTSNLGFSGARLAPILANAGYCVYAFNYGETSSSLGRVYGLGDITESARTMSAFVDRVLAATGTTRVDVIGNSQGGMMPNYYIKRLGGAAKVRTMVGLAPTNHGTTMGGLVDIARSLNVLGLVNDAFRFIGAPAYPQQEEGSDFQTALFADGDTVPGVRYLTIATTHDNTVTPLTNSFLHGGDSTNVLLQDLCPDDPVGHSGLWFDGPVTQIVLNALGPDEPGFQPECTDYGPTI
ncbi:alpha/beta fold hydrolase [Actinomadura sp. NAK00032]|uniref:esterase/lipase family protein n=1 Tax=Actinomadura sp. NAK00032 TaxID=2742128 RepID=UPI0015929328|nr:alpha/beta fold hydrolase [Actinomadura sp. NAK00032]QKW33137.1 alpha/beta fold hydrolase [Actinomadura sp. NAK00032]